MFKVYSSRVRESVDVQFDNIIIDAEPSNFGLNKIVLPISIRGLKTRAEEILTEIVFATINPVERIKLSISINGVIIAREVKPIHLIDYDSIYWMSTVYDVTELLKNRLNPLYQRLKIYYQGNDVKRLGYMSMLAIYDANDVESTYTYISGLEKIRESQVYKLTWNREFSKDKSTDLLVSSLMTYSATSLNTLEVCKTSKGCVTAPLKHGFTELKFRNALIREVSLKKYSGSGEHGALLTNYFDFCSSTNTPRFELLKYSTRSSKDGSTIVNVEFSVIDGSEGDAQFILIDKGIPVGRIRRRVEPGSTINLYFKSKNALTIPVIRILFFKHSKSWIFDYYPRED
ncbi:MAG: hypothetical protein F7B59_01840 [Desulfurococcales archaeon]|nr:hypothetical protein [Desulfurococcales archaeon]